MASLMFRKNLLGFDFFDHGKLFLQHGNLRQKLVGATRPARRSNLFCNENVISNLHDDSTEMHPPINCFVKLGYYVVRVYPSCCSSPSKRFLKS